MLDCFLYTAERQTLFDTVEHFIPKFARMTKNSKYDLLTTGIRNNDPDYNQLNYKITIAVQKYILQTKRFYNN